MLKLELAAANSQLDLAWPCLGAKDGGKVRGLAHLQAEVQQAAATTSTHWSLGVTDLTAVGGGGGGGCSPLPFQEPESQPPRSFRIPCRTAFSGHGKWRPGLG